jgi:hypothetical protein
VTGLFVLACCNQFLEHWKRLAGPDPMPHTRTFLDRATALIRDALIFELTPDGTLVRFMGSGVVAQWKEDITGTYLERFVAPNDKARFRQHVEAVCRHPVGLRARDDMRTSRGCKLEYEMMLLPLAVDLAKPLRCVVYLRSFAELDHHDDKVDFAWPAASTWMDIGAGTPSGHTSWVQEPP